MSKIITLTPEQVKAHPLIRKKGNTMEHGQVRKDMSIMKNSIIFMDIDGVINNYLYCERMKNEPKNPNLPLLTEMDLSMMKRIVRLATETNSDIVLSSSWKAVWNYKKADIGKANMQKMFDYVGIHIIDTTPDLTGGRAKEIKQWLDEHPTVTHFVSLDDDYPESYYKKAGIPNHTIHTKYWCIEESQGGFQEKHYQKALDILKTEYNKTDM